MSLVRETVRVEEAAEILGIGRGSAYAAVRRGEIPAVTIGRLKLIPRRALDRMLEPANDGSDGRTAGGESK